ncbi:MAG TPA: NADPH-dependent F420 reductase [Anaerolineae bacterium]|nr:NADPH-dependent F420 reductase [Caldilineae bacterium]HID34303.1 NADPH-dependent F420 reductase [Anaerolineae bacterium]HIQ11685.1 NADPH-dependent F420 reductase [Caldilineales bacterium]
MTHPTSLGVVAVIGGTGAEGSGFAMRWARAGLDVVIGSRSAEKGARVAQELKARLGDVKLRGTSNLEAARMADVVVLSVPYESQTAIIEDIRPGLAGKVLVTVVAPLLGEKKGRYAPPPGGSAALEAQAQVGPETRVVAAFQNVSAHHLADLDHMVDCDVLVCGNRRADREIAIALAQAAGMRGVHAGALQNSAVTEGMTAVLIAINAIYKTRNAGIRITGIDA